MRLYVHLHMYIQASSDFANFRVVSPAWCVVICHPAIPVSFQAKILLSNVQGSRNPTVHPRPLQEVAAPVPVLSLGARLRGRLSPPGAGEDSGVGVSTCCNERLRCMFAHCGGSRFLWRKLASLKARCHWKTDNPHSVSPCHMGGRNPHVICSHSSAMTPFWSRAKPDAVTIPVPSSSLPASPAVQR